MTSLTFQYTPLGDAGLSGFQSLTNLERLTVGDAAITDAGLLHLRSQTSLRELSVHNTLVTEAGIVDLKRALPELRVYQ